LQSALATIMILRENYASVLAIELWHMRDELEADHADLLAQYGVIVHCFEDHVYSASLGLIESNVGPRRFQLKALAVLHSSFEEILLVDSDCTPLSDPLPLFEHLSRSAFSAMFWPDYWVTHPENPIWEVIDVAPDLGYEFESGQMVINKKRAWKALNLCVHFNTEFYMRLLNGDKDTFRIAWMATQTPYLLVQHRALPVGMLATDGSFCGHAILQHHPSGHPMFLHHNQVKRAEDINDVHFSHVATPALSSKSAKVQPRSSISVGSRSLHCVSVQDERETVRILGSPLLEVFEILFRQAFGAAGEKLIA
jgi:hypothetical protein